MALQSEPVVRRCSKSPNAKLLNGDAARAWDRIKELAARLLNINGNKMLICNNQFTLVHTDVVRIDISQRQVRLSNLVSFLNAIFELTVFFKGDC